MHIINQISSARESHVIVKSDGHEDWGNLILPQSRTANTFEQYYNLSYPSIFSLIAHNPCGYYMLNSVPLVLYNLIGCHNNPPVPQEPCCTNKETIFKRWVSGQHSLLCGSMRFKPRSDLLTSGATRKNGKPRQTRGQMILIWLIFWMLSLHAGCCPLFLRLALGQNSFPLNLNQGYANEETDIKFWSENS